MRRQARTLTGDVSDDSDKARVSDEFEQKFVFAGFGNFVFVDLSAYFVNILLFA